MAYAELGAIISKSGSAYTYIYVNYKKKPSQFRILFPF